MPTVPLSLTHDHVSDAISLVVGKYKFTNTTAQEQGLEGVMFYSQSTNNKDDNNSGHSDLPPSGFISIVLVGLVAGTTGTYVIRHGSRKESSDWLARRDSLDEHDRRCLGNTPIVSDFKQSSSTVRCREMLS
jgi:hypothetical protein